MSFKDRLSRYTPKNIGPLPGDFYVAPYGSDKNDGSKDRPFKTIERAAEAVREIKDQRTGCISVCLMAGQYLTDGIRFTEEDSGREDLSIVYRAYGDGEVIINGGVSLNPADFEHISDEIRERLHGDARDHVMQIDLKRYGLTEKDWGVVCPIGKYSMHEKYDNHVEDSNCELFINGRRMTLARYPDGGFDTLDAVANVGDCFEFPEQNYYHDWHERRNHDGGSYQISKRTTARLKTWKSLEDIWVYGYFFHDWADSSTPVKAFDLEHRTFYPEYVSKFGAKKGGQFYFYNVLDELDTPGEWYLDRKEGILYLYSPVPLWENPSIEMTITRNNIIHAENVHHLLFEDLTIKGTRSDAIVMTGNDNVVRRMKIYGVLGNAIMIEGLRNLVTECDISHVGKGGIWLTGGDRNTLTPGQNVADNNLIHDWAEVYLTYFGGVHLYGVGNVCSHNEMYNTPHTAIFYYGNDHLIEYNYLHEVVQRATDAGAIYTGQDWAGCGSVVRYNILENVGSDGFRPDGIYFDDMSSGQTAYGNLLINVVKYGFQLGGGRDLHVFNNIVVNSLRGLSYDDRGRDALVGHGWAISGVVSYEEGSMWRRLRRVPYQSEIWANRYPLLAQISHDYSNMDDPNFGPNPAYSHIHDNLLIDLQNLGPRFVESAYQFSLLERNCVYNSFEHAGITDDYYLNYGCQAANDMPGFENIPFEKIGRY